MNMLDETNTQQNHRKCVLDGEQWRRTRHIYIQSRIDSIYYYFINICFLEFVIMVTFTFVFFFFSFQLLDIILYMQMWLITWEQ